MKYKFVLEGYTENPRDEELLSHLIENASDYILCIRGEEGESLVLKPTCTDATTKMDIDLKIIS